MLQIIFLLKLVKPLSNDYHRVQANNSRENIRDVVRFSNPGELIIIACIFLFCPYFLKFGGWGGGALMPPQPAL